MFKYNPIGAVIEYDHNAKLKYKGVKYQLFSCDKATIYLFIYLILSNENIILLKSFFQVKVLYLIFDFDVSQ